MPTRLAEGKPSVRSAMVLETLLDPERKKQRGPLQVKDATPLPLEEAKPSALPAKDAAQLAWVRLARAGSRCTGRG